jgi:hypothetical protein
LNIVDEEDDDAWTRLGVSTSVLYHFGQNAMPGPFVGLGGSFTLYDEGDAANQLGVHTLLGANVAIAPNFFFRMTAGAGHAFENDDFEPRWTYFATVGLSHNVGGSTSAVAMRNR